MGASCDPGAGAGCAPEAGPGAGAGLGAGPGAGFCFPLQSPPQLLFTVTLFPPEEPVLFLKSII